MPPKEIPCKYVSSAVGCRRTRCPYLHPGKNGSSKSSKRPTSRRSSRRDSDEVVTQRVRIPQKRTGILIGREGKTINEIRDRYSSSSVEIDTSENSDLSVVTIRGSEATVRNILIDFHDRFRNVGVDSSFLDGALAKFGVSDEPNSDCGDNDSMSVASVTSTETQKKSSAAAVEGNATPRNHSRGSVDTEAGSNPRIRPAEAVPVTSGISPKSRSSSTKVPPQNIAWTTTGYGHRDTASSCSSGAGWPEEEPDLPGPLQELEEFRPLSQHAITQPTSSSSSGPHHSPLSTIDGEIVTYLAPCDCGPECSYGKFRNCVDMHGFIPMASVSPVITLILCPYCDETKEFYTETDYLRHLCGQHFRRRLSLYLKQSPPFRCPLKSCGKEVDSFSSLLEHYGGTPHKKVGSMVLDSVGERVKNMRGILIGRFQAHIEAYSENVEALQRDCNRLRSKNQDLSNSLARSVIREESKLKAEAEVTRLQEKINNLETNKDQHRDWAQHCEKITKEKELAETLLVQERQSYNQFKDTMNGTVKDLHTRLEHSHRSVNQLNKNLQDLENTKHEELTRKDREVMRQEERIRRLEQELAAAVKVKNINSPSTSVSSSSLFTPVTSSSQDKDFLIQKLQRTVKSQRDMLNLKEQEIVLLREQLVTDGPDVIGLD